MRNHMKDAKVVVGFAMANTVKEQQATAWFFVFEDKEHGQDYFKSISNILEEKFNSFVCEISVSELIQTVKQIKELLPEVVFQKTIGRTRQKITTTPTTRKYKIRLSVRITNIFPKPGQDNDMARIRQAIKENNASLLFNIKKEGSI